MWTVFIIILMAHFAFNPGYDKTQNAHKEISFANFATL